MIPESLPWPILNTNEHQTNLRNKRSLSRRGRRNSAPPKPIYIEGKKWYFITKIVLTYCEKNDSSD